MAQKSGAAGLVLFGAVFLAIGIGAGILSGRTLRRAEAMRSWRETPATVLQCDLESHRGSKGGTTYSVKAVYQYEAEGRRYTSSLVSLHAGADNIGRFHQRAYTELKRCMAEKKPAVCWVNPRSPGEAILYRAPRAEMLIFMQLFALAFGGAGLAVVLTGLSGLLLRPDAEPLAGQGLIRMRGAAAHRVAAALALAWNGYMAWFLWKTFAVMAPDPLPWYLWGMGVTGMVPAVVAGYLVGRIRKFGVSVFEMSPMPGVLGGPVSGTIRIPARVETETGIDVVLQCVHQYTTGSGKHRSTHRDVLWEAPRHFDAGLAYGDETMLPIRFAVPYDKPATNAAGGSDGYYWRLSAKASAPGIDYKAVFDVPVRHTPQSVPEFVPPQTVDATAALEPVEAPLAREGLRLEPRPEGGFELVFPAGRPRAVAVSLAVCMFVCTAVCAVLWTIAHAPLLLAVCVTAFDAFLAVTLVGQLALTRGIEVVPARRELVTWSRMAGLQRRERRFSFDRVTQVRSERAGQTGNTMLYRVVLTVDEGMPVTVGSGLRMWNDAEDVAKLLRASLAPGFELHGLRV